MHAEAQRIVRVVDTVCPEIILAPDTGGTLLPGPPYQAAGYRSVGGIREDHLRGDGFLRKSRLRGAGGALL